MLHIRANHVAHTNDRGHAFKLLPGTGINNCIVTAETVCAVILIPISNVREVLPLVKMQVQILQNQLYTHVLQ